MKKAIKPWTIGRIIKWSVTLLVLVPIGVALSGFGLLRFLERPLHKPSFLVQMTVDMQVNNEPVKIERILRCATFVTRGGQSAGYSIFGFEVRRRNASYAVDVGAIGKRLSDGSAVMMWPPYYCVRKIGETTRKMAPVSLAANIIPFMAWTPNADHPQMIEVYPSPAYFRKPYARIKNIQVRIDPAPEGSRADPPDEFEWFTQKALNGEDRPKTNSIRFSGASIQTLTEKQWKNKNPNFDKVISAFREPIIFGPKFAYFADQSRSKTDTSKIYYEAGKIFRDSLAQRSILNQQRTEQGMKYAFHWHVSPTTFPLFDFPRMSNELPLSIDAMEIKIDKNINKSYFILYNKRYILNNRKFFNIKWKNIILNTANCIACYYLFDPDSGNLSEIFPVGLKVRPRWSSSDLITGKKY